MSSRHRLLAVATALATATGSFAIPTASAEEAIFAKTVEVHNQGPHTGLGIHTLTYIPENQNWGKDQEINIRLLMAKDYSSKIYPRSFGLSLNDAFSEAIDRDATEFKQFLTTQDIKKNFPEELLTNLPQRAQAWLNTTDTVKARNTLKTELEWDSAKRNVGVADPDWWTDNTGIDNEIIATEFTVKLKDDVDIADLTAGSFAWVPNNDISGYSWGVNFQTFLYPVTVERKSVDTPFPADREDKTQANPAPGADMAEDQDDNGLNKDDQANNNQIGLQSDLSLIPEKKPTPQQEEGPNGQSEDLEDNSHTGLQSETDLKKQKDADQTQDNPSDNTNPQSKSIWWKILLGILGALGLGGGLIAMLFGKR